jgi:hypothetical protein
VIWLWAYSYNFDIESYIYPTYGHLGTLFGSFGGTQMASK